MNPLISKQVNVNSPQYYLRNEKKNLRSLSPGYAQVKKQNTTMPFTFPTEQSVLHSSVPTNTQEVENRKRDLAKLEEKMQETLSKSIEKTKVQHSKNSSKGYIASKSKSPMKTINPTTCKKISQDLPKSAQKILTEIANRSKSNNTSFSKINTQSFKPSQNPRILQNIYSHKRPAQDNQNSENNIQEEGNQTMQDETLESFYREIEKNKEYLSNQRAYSSVSPIAIDKKLLSTLEKNNKRVQQIYSQIQNQMKQKVASPNQGDTYGKHKPSPSKTDNRKVLYESYSQEKIHQILHGGQLLANIDQDGKLINNNNESRKPSPLFGGRQDENGGTHHSSQDSSSLNQFKSHLTDSPAAEQYFNTIPSIPSCVGTGQFVTLPNECFNSFKITGTKERLKTAGQTHQSSTSQSNFNFIGKYKQSTESKNKTQITSLTKFMKKLNNEQYQGSSQLYQQLQRSQKIAQEQYKNNLISPQRKNQQFFGQSTGKDSFITPTRQEQSSQKDRTPEKPLSTNPISPSGRAFIVKGSKSNSETPKNQNTNFQFSQQAEIIQNNQNAQNIQNQKNPIEQLNKQNQKVNGNSNLIIIKNKKQQKGNQRKSKDNIQQITNTQVTTNQDNKIDNIQIQYQIEKLNEQNKMKDQQIEQLNHQVRYLIEQITRQSHLYNEEEQSINTQSFDQKSEKFNSSRQYYPNEKHSNYSSVQQRSDQSNEVNQYNIYANGTFNQQLVQEGSYYNSQQKDNLSQQQLLQQHLNNPHQQPPQQSPSSNSNSGKTNNHQKQISFSIQDQQHNSEDYNSGYHTEDAQNHQIEYSYDNQEIQSEPLNENSIQQLEKRCKTEEEDYIDNTNNYHYNDSINTPPNNNILTHKSADLIPQQVTQDYNQIQLIQQSLSQKESQEQHQMGDIKIVNNFQATLIESVDIKTSVHSSSVSHSQVVENVNLIVQKSSSQNSERANSHRESYQTPYERSMQQPQSQQKEDEKSIQDHYQQ